MCTLEKNPLLGPLQTHCKLFVYWGIKINHLMYSLTKRFCNSARTSSHDVTLSQLWNGNGNITYCPIANKICNSLTQQAGGVMAASNALLDRFILTVLQRLYPNIDSEQLASHRRYCSLSIFTAGSQQCDSFANSPHVDDNDSFEKTFQTEALVLINEIRSLYAYDENVMNDLKYIEILAGYRGGFCVPTTCGYSIVSMQSQEEASILSSSEFAMIGLGVSVKLVSNSYHYFMAPLFTHCTPVSLTIHKSGYVSLYSGKYNVVGWGGSQSSTQSNYKKKNARGRRKRKRN